MPTRLVPTTTARLAAFVMLVVIVFGSATALAQPAAPSTDADMVRGLTPTVVNIRVVASSAPEEAALAAVPVMASQPRVLSGSGFVVDASGLIATNAHVVDGALDIMVTFADGRSAPAKIVDTIRLLDLAVLQVATDHPLPTVRWSDSATVQPGDEVFAFGNPLGIGLSVSAGIVSAVNRDLMETPYDNFIQTDAVINHGNSGGPLFNTKGEVVGVDTVIVSPTAGYAGLGFAIPANTVRFAIERVRQFGWVRPGWIGIQSSAVTADMAAALGMPSAEGVMIGTVTADSPAAKAGLRVGDVVLRFGDIVPADERALQRLIIAAPIAQAVPVTIWRGGKQSVLPVTVAEWSRRDYDLRNGQPAQPVKTAIRPDLGLTLSTITDTARAQHELAPGQTGVLVTGVMAGTDAWIRGLKTGDVILRVQDAAVANSADVQQQIDHSRSMGRKFALFLIRRKGFDNIGPRWIALRVSNDGAVADVVEIRVA